MKEKLRFLGLDVYAETIAVAIAEPDGEVRSLGTIPNRGESIRKMIKKLGPAEKLRVCYEAGPTGYVVYWQLAELGVQCTVVAPTLVPTKAGDRVKTDRRDAESWRVAIDPETSRRYGFPTRVPRLCEIWCALARQPSRIRCERGI